MKIKKLFSWTLNNVLRWLIIALALTAALSFLTSCKSSRHLPKNHSHELLFIMVSLEDRGIQMSQETIDGILYSGTLKKSVLYQ